MPPDTHDREQEELADDRYNQQQEDETFSEDSLDDGEATPLLSNSGGHEDCGCGLSHQCMTAAVEASEQNDGNDTDIAAPGYLVDSESSPPSDQEVNSVDHEGETPTADTQTSENNTATDNSTSDAILIPHRPGYLIETEDDELSSVSTDDNVAAANGPTCFVATAAFDSQYHPTVEYLRSFRDNDLSRSHIGRAFIRMYWIAGPILAIPVARSYGLRMFSRGLLGLIVKIIKLCKNMD